MRKNQDAENYIFGPEETAGFVFSYGNRKLGRSRPISRQETDLLGPAKGGNFDDVPLFVWCRRCGVYMDFIRGRRDELDARWRCPVCGTGVMARTAFRRLEEENDEFLDRMEYEDDTDW